MRRATQWVDMPGPCVCGESVDERQVRGCRGDARGGAAGGRLPGTGRLGRREHGIRPHRDLRARCARRLPGGGSAAGALGRLTVRQDGPIAGYDRVKQFGPAWTDNQAAPGGHNGCDTRRRAAPRPNRREGRRPLHRRVRHAGRPLHRAQHRLRPRSRDEHRGADRPYGRPRQRLPDRCRVPPPGHPRRAGETTRSTSPPPTARPTRAKATTTPAGGCPRTPRSAAPTSPGRSP